MHTLLMLADLMFVRPRITPQEAAKLNPTGDLSGSMLGRMHWTRAGNCTITSSLTLS
jgi:hypothetical protein